MNAIGLGNPNASIAVYIGNRPPIEPFQSLSTCQFLESGDISRIAQETGNHWRKVFNCYAKLAFLLEPQGFKSWQSLRDDSLLQKGSSYGLFFSAADLSSKDQIKIYCGKSHFSNTLNTDVVWVDSFFAINNRKKLIVAPYFDYRQLSNVKLEKLVKLIQGLKQKASKMD